jgi:hypothetical protein
MLSTVTLHEKVKTESSTTKTYLVITPGGMTCQLQVPDAVNKAFTDYVICTENCTCLTCPVKPAGNMTSLSQALLGSGFRMLGMTFQPIPFSRFLRNCSAVHQVILMEQKMMTCETKAIKKTLLVVTEVLVVTSELCDVACGAFSALQPVGRLYPCPQ